MDRMTIESIRSQQQLFLMNVNLRQLRAFVSVAQLGSFTRAAESLHLSQPALTVPMPVARLQQPLGDADPARPRAAAAVAT
jgi:hypothetical protein